MKLELIEIRNDEEIKDFLRAKPRRESTELAHLKRLKGYCNFIGKKPVDLIKEAEDEEEDRIRMKKRQIRKYFIDYSEFLRNKGRSQYTISNHFSSIKSFYRNAEVELPSISINSNSEIKKTRNEAIPSKDDIRVALKHCKFKYRSIILLMSSSGLGSGEIRNLTFGDFLNAIDEFLDYEDFDVVKIAKMLDKKENIIGSWNVHRQKQGNSYYTFSSPESITAITDYLAERQKRDGLIKSKEDPLFENFGKKIPEYSFSKTFQRINDDAGLGFSGRQRFFKSHALRKYFASTLHKNGLSQINIDWMLGHDISGVNRAYIKADPSKLKEEYLKVVKDLSIEKVEVQMVTTEGYDNLIDKLEERDQKYNTLNKRLNKQADEFKAVKQHLQDIEDINMQLLELDIEINAIDASNNDILVLRKAGKLTEQKKKLNNEKIELMAKNNPRYKQLLKQREISREESSSKQMQEKKRLEEEKMRERERGLMLKEASDRN